MNAPVLPAYRHMPLFPRGEDRTTYRKLDCDGVRTERALGREIVVIAADALRQLTEAAFVDINHLLRPSHLRQLRAILDDPEASENDRFVAYDLIKIRRIEVENFSAFIVIDDKGNDFFQELNLG
jgi:fumarate hydratase class I